MDLRYIVRYIGSRGFSKDICYLAADDDSPSRLLGLGGTAQF